MTDEQSSELIEGLDNLKDALKAHLYEIAPGLKADFESINTRNPSEMVQFLRKLEGIGAEKKKRYHDLVMPRVQQEGIDKIVMADLTLHDTKEWKKAPNGRKIRRILTARTILFDKRIVRCCAKRSTLSQTNYLLISP